MIFIHSGHIQRNNIVKKKIWTAWKVAKTAKILLTYLSICQHTKYPTMSAHCLKIFQKSRIHKVTMLGKVIIVSLELG